MAGDPVGFTLFAWDADPGFAARMTPVQLGTDHPKGYGCGYRISVEANPDVFQVEEDR